MDIHAEVGSGQLDVGLGLWRESRAAAADLTVVGFLLVFRVMRPGEASWVEGVAEDGRGPRTATGLASIYRAREGGPGGRGDTGEWVSSETRTLSGRRGPERSLVLR